MTRQLNPFIYGKPVPPSHFIGRDDIINNCYNRLAGYVRSSIAISGEHGIGKTSLLHYVGHLTKTEQWGQPHTKNIFIHLDCQTIKQFTPTRFWYRTLELLKQAGDNFALHQQIDDLLSQPDIDATHFQRLLRQLHQQQSSLILSLDGFTSVVKTDPAHRTTTSDFLSSLRALINHPDYALTLLTATREPLDTLCYDLVKEHGSPFYNNFTFETLSPFTPDEIETLLQQALDQASYKFDQIDRKLLHRIAGAHPALLQMAGYHLFEAHRQPSLTEHSYKKVIDDFERSARHYFSLFWNESTLLEQTLFILTILIHLSEQISPLKLDTPVEEAYSLLQQYERDLVRLIEWGLIQRIEDSYQIFSIVFIWWIIREVAAESEEEATRRYKMIGEETQRRVWQTLKKLAPYLTLNKLTQTLVTRSSRSPLSSVAKSESKFEKVPFPQESRHPMNISLVALPSRYELQKELGRGASGVVYKAFDTRLARMVAIKSLHTHIEQLSTDSLLLLKEARAASQLQHPHIVTIYDVVEANDYIFLVMEYLEGNTLVDLLEEKDHLPLTEVITLVEQAASALDYAHTQGVIHRDIKPANLMISITGELKLADFGIAKMVGETHTTSGGLKGTVIYMSPEQVNQETLDGRSDLFSLATVTFEMLSGKSPWLGTTPFDLMTSITNAPPRSLADFDLPDAAILEPVLQKGLAKSPDERYQSGAEFIKALRQAAAM